MSILRLSCVWACLSLLSLGLEPFETVKERTADKWTLKDIADPGTLVHLKVVLKNPNDASFEELVSKIATPFSGHYRKHLTASQLAHWVEPAQSDVAKVQQWLARHGINSEQNHDLVVASISTSEAQELLNTTYYNYQHLDGRIVQRTPEYYLPAHLAELVELVHPTVNFPFEGHHLEEPSGDTVSLNTSSIYGSNLDVRSTDPCDSNITTPACANQVYNATYMASLSSNITMVDLATYGDQPNRTNIELYLKRYNPLPLKRKDYVLSTAVGGKDHHADPVNVFDRFLQMMMGHGGALRGMATGLNGKVGVYEWGPAINSAEAGESKLNGGERGFLDYLHDLAHAEGVPSVVAQAQWAPESTLSEKYMYYLCKVFSRVAARGITFLQQVGDYGSEALPDKKGIITFEGAFPSTCPWVSGVGATVWDTQNKTELAATWQTRDIQGKTLVALSSGLFSQVFTRPKYQDTLVPGYVQRAKLEEMYGKNSNTTGFNGTGRALPDFSVLATKIPTILNGKLFVGNNPVFGAPIAAGFIGRLNAYEQSKGRPLLGAVNTFFYQRPDLFNDITCCGNNGVVQSYPRFKNYSDMNPYGFPVAKGWDAVTGLGSFRFSEIQKALDDMAAAGALD